MTQESQPAAQTHTQLIFIWIALFVSQVMFLVIAFVAKPELLRFDFSKPVSGDKPMTVAIFGVLGVVLIGASFLIRKRLVDQAIDRQTPQMLQTALIAGSAMCEAASIFGVVLAFTHSYQYFFLWIAAAMAGMVFHFPSRTNMINASFRGS